MIFKYKVTIPASRTFFRDVEINEGSSLYRVMEFLQSQMNFVPDMMILFQGIDEKGKVLHEYGLFDMGDGSIDNVTLRDAAERGEVVLRFIYNLSKNLYLDLTFAGECEADARAEYPRVTGEKGHAPQQFSAVYVEDDYENRPHGIPHPVADDVPDDDDDDDDADDEKDDEEEGYDEDELPEGTE